ncbi:hypothetical protein CAPI_04860 [Corynebacterium capitovis DSM 44611]|uniref:DUF3099 domain-containing protein n=1 Tax=Corynebacterium capitovis TaxID=131081 RepID=UPI00036A9E2A|nr:DUF3099 domain-containing protein [Corynebacterium capitovis]WKD57530.1 hypothetical protein CAPI_04860 [Corynebacterium capitovis DSM 44611]
MNGEFPNSAQFGDNRPGDDAVDAVDAVDSVDSVDAGSEDAKHEGHNAHRPHRWRLARRSERHLITDAVRSPEQNIRSRERRYIAIQSLRLPFIAIAILAALGWHNWWIAGVMFTVSIPLPWVAVMIGNGQGEKRDPRARNVYKPAAAREAYRVEMERRSQLDAGGPESAHSQPAIIDHVESADPDSPT